MAIRQTPKGRICRAPGAATRAIPACRCRISTGQERDAFIAKASYDFTRLGLEGVTAYALFVHGWGRVDPSTKESVPNENEFDADLQWRPQWKFLKGLWFRVRYANVHQYEGPKNTINDFRVIVNYDFPLL